MTDKNIAQIILPSQKTSLEERLGNVDIVSARADPNFFYDPETGVYIDRENILARINFDTSNEERDAIMQAGIMLGEYEILQKTLLIETVKSLREQGIEEDKIKAYVKQTVCRTDLNWKIMDEIYGGDFKTRFNSEQEEDIEAELEEKVKCIKTELLYACFAHAQTRIKYGAYTDRNERFALRRSSDELYFQILDQLKPYKDAARFNLKGTPETSELGFDGADDEVLPNKLFPNACRLLFNWGLEKSGYGTDSQQGREATFEDRYLRLVRFDGYDDAIRPENKTAQPQTADRQESDLVKA
ncbi:MAG: hypothetical protein PHF67_05075 [Candidatus Nanoarchaeia archaeon]|nr:hypothetical protein [Candidatus Nanoarchaeia archaeon]